MSVSSPSLTSYYPAGPVGPNPPIGPIGALGRLCRGFTWTAVKTPKWSTIVQKSSGGGVTTIANYQNPIWEWTLNYDYILNDPNRLIEGSAITDLNALIGFFLYARGQAIPFVYDDPYDNYVGPAILPGGSTRNPQAQLRVVTDGTNYYSPIQRIWGTAGAAFGSFQEDITDIVDSTFEVGNESTFPLPTSDYSILQGPLAIAGETFGGLYIAWTAEPASNIYAQFNFVNRVRFATDDVDFEQFMGLLFTIGGSEGKNGNGQLKLTTARPPGV